MEQQKKKNGWITWLLLIFIPIIGIIVMWISRKDYSNKKKGILTIVFSLWFILVLASSPDSSNTDTAAIDAGLAKETQLEDSDIATNESTQETENTDTDPEANENTGELQEQDNDSKYPDSINGIDVMFDESVRNDVTGRWRLARVATTISTEEFALDYYKAFFKDDDEVHIIVNFTLNTTTVLNVFGDTISCDIHEYIDKEEHDASVLAGGMLLASYGINIDTGAIEKLVDEDTEQEVEDASLPVDTSKQSSDVQEPAETSNQAAESSTAESNTAQMVWIDDTGKKYHSRSTCSNMSNPYQVEIPVAENRGYEPCKKCY